MAIYLFECESCGEAWEVLTTIAHDTLCPKCRAEGSRRFAPGAFAFDAGCSQDWERLSPGVQRMVMENKRILETPEKQAEIRSGKLKLTEGQRWTRPEMERRVY